MSGKGKANIATQSSLALGFPEFSEQHALARQPDVSASVVRFEQWMEDPNSPDSRSATGTGTSRQSRRQCRMTSRRSYGPPWPSEEFASLYSHQAECFDLIQAGKNVVVVTPTASGKTLCYNLPVLNRILREPGARAMYLFPTKALAEDQLHEFQAVGRCDGSGYQGVYL